jgi:hypothetical protein
MAALEEIITLNNTMMETANVLLILMLPEIAVAQGAHIAGQVVQPHIAHHTDYNALERISEI